ncbi:MAG: S-layer homology domain-containing protein, partial [Bacillota bacterium]|nr:S-layer homology domain-containing protein [Bacillota bacterium]
KEPGFNLEGEGTQDHPYLVKSAEDMVNLQQAVNEWNLNFDGQYVKMASNITLPDDWTPIGTDKKTPFKGTFDGGNFLLTVPEGGKPLFGVVSGDSVLRNLDIQGKRIEGCGVINEYIVDVSSITIENVTLKSGTQTLKSGFIGDYGNLPVTIRNCTVEKGVVIGYDKQQSHIGSFGGEINGYFENCVSHATVYGVDYVGGINANKGQTMRPYEIRNCIFDGEVVASGSYAGGISGGGYAGTNWGLDTSPNSPWPVIQNCISAGKITGQDCVGGILGGEPGVVQCWDNGIGYIQNNLFTGTVQATGENARIGGIAGYVHGLDKYVEINNNYFAADCGAGLGIGFVKYVDTNNENVSQGGVDKATETYYFDTSDGGKGAAYPKGATRINQNRTDDPLGADVEQLTKAVTEEQLKDGTVTQWLNEGPNSLKNWIQGETSPVFSNEAVLLGLTLSGEFKTSYVMGEEFSTENMVITATYSDGSSKVLNPDDVAFKGFNGMTKGTQTITVSYDVAKTEYTVTVTPSEEDQKAADSVIDLIDAIGKVTKDSGDAIAAARDAYDKANDVQKSLIINYKKLEAAEAKYAELTKDIKVPFGDVKKTQWFYSDVAYVYDKGVMTGMTDTQFGPNEDLTRGQFVTILGRYAGVKDSSKGSPADKTFNDVKETNYYASHVKWAVEQKITNGVSETKFAPEEKITREQMAAMMYRYAAAMKVALPEGDGSKFSDDGKIS